MFLSSVKLLLLNYYLFGHWYKQHHTDNRPKIWIKATPSGNKIQAIGKPCKTTHKINQKRLRILLQNVSLEKTYQASGKPQKYAELHITNLKKYLYCLHIYMVRTDYAGLTVIWLLTDTSFEDIRELSTRDSMAYMPESNRTRRSWRSRSRLDV